jgi:hypothetical protein
MQQSEVLSRMQYSGYELLAAPHTRSPGFGGLLVAIRAAPTLAHFDPEIIRLCLIDPASNPYTTTLQLTSHLSGPQRVGPGRVVVSDRLNKRLGYFIYGGMVEAICVSRQTIYQITSPAPLFVLNRSTWDELGEQLAVETEALFARLSAAWRTDHAGFRRRLAQTEPLMLYAATLRSLHLLYSRSQALRRMFPRLFDVIRAEERWVSSNGQLPSAVVPLEELLDPT